MPVHDGFPTVQGRCPACGGAGLFLGSGGHVTCPRLDCPNPSAADDLLHQRAHDWSTTEQQPTEDEARQLPCSLWLLSNGHAPHWWQLQPGMGDVLCPGAPRKAAATQPQQPATMDVPDLCECGGTVAHPECPVHSPGPERQPTGE